MAEQSTTTGADAGPRQCFFCTMMPLLERRWHEATKGHFRNSRVEFLKGIRSLIDDRIERMSREERKGTHVTVE